MNSIPFFILYSTSQSHCQTVLSTLKFTSSRIAISSLRIRMSFFTQNHLNDGQLSVPLPFVCFFFPLYISLSLSLFPSLSRPLSLAASFLIKLKIRGTPFLLFSILREYNSTHLCVII